MTSLGTTRRFLKPGEASFASDKSDLDTTSATAFVFNANNNLPIQRQRQRLPVFQVRNHILYLLENYQTLIILGETGSGKSTQIPQYLVESGWGEDGVVAITQPRRVSCTSLATRVAEECDVILGREVGYCIRFDDNCTPGQTKIKFLTEGILVREMMADPLLRQYCVIMLDEVHERSLYTDILLGLLKKVLRRRKDLRVIVCSATIDAQHMFTFFNSNKTDDKSKDSVATLGIEGRTYPVDIHYLKAPCPDYVKEAALTAAHIHLTEAAGVVLVFLTGVDEVLDCQELINEHIRGKQAAKASSALILPMHGSLPYAEQLRVFQSTAPGVRKIIVATNIAETSITIPGVNYVIDSGVVKMRVYGHTTTSSPTAKCLTESLVVMPLSKASATQRAGRAGRTGRGKVYRLYTEDQFSELSDATPPEMVRTNLNGAVLNLLALGIDNMLRFDFPSPPPALHLSEAFQELFALGAVSPDVKLTEGMGDKMAEMPIVPSLAKMILNAGSFSCCEEMSAIVALLQVQSVFVTPSNKAHAARVQHSKFQVEEGDLLSLLNVFTAWQRNGQSKHWSSKHFVNHKSLLRADDIRKRIVTLMNKWNIKNEQDISRSRSSDSVRRCITSGMFASAAYLHYSGEYRTVRGDSALYIHPSSVLYTLTQPKWVVYQEVLQTNRPYMKDITVIEENWLVELASHYYKKGG